MSDSYDDYEAKIQLAEQAWEKRVDETAKRVHEPVYAFRRKGLDDFCTCDKRRYDELSGKPDLFEVAVFYTAPPKREWVGLTDEEIALICGECAASAHRTDDISYARAIEVKLKEKNA